MQVIFSCSPECKEEISELPIVENLLVILQEYDLLSKRLEITAVHVSVR